MCIVESVPASVNRLFSLVSLPREVPCFLGDLLGLARAGEVPLCSKDSLTSASGSKQEPSGFGVIPLHKHE